MLNSSSEFEFLLLKFSEVWEVRILVFVLFLILYLATVTGNLLVVFAVALDHHLHTPMHFFLMNLAIQDLGQISVIVPKSMSNSLMNTRRISFSGCVAQVHFFLFFIASDISLLTIMAYDRYVAICKPLHYELVMNRKACIKMVVISWVSGFLYGILHTSGTFAIPFCSNIVNQFFCEIPQLLKLVCTNFYLIEIGAVVLSIGIVFGCFIFIIVTYWHILIVVLRIPSGEGKQKAFSTCVPHLIVFSMLVITGSLAYLRPPSSDTPSCLDLIISVIYSIFPPMLNPVIYSMRNKEIKAALSKLLGFGQSSKNI